MEREELEQQLDELAYQISRKYGLEGWAYDLCDEIEGAILTLQPLEVLQALKARVQGQLKRR